MSLRLGWWSCLLALTLTAGVASAQMDDEAPPTVEPGGVAAEAPPETAPDEDPTMPGGDDTDPHELENTDYFFLGALYRHVFIPAFIQRVAPVQGGIDADNPGVGLSFTYRRNNFGVTANLFWNGAQGQGFYRENDDPPTDMEHIIADMGVVFVTAELMWSIPIVDWFAVELGFDLGFGFVYGTIRRSEAYESSPGANDWQPCNGVGNPSAQYCEASGDYGVTEPNWLENGDIPIIVPWLSVPHVALRFKPIRQLQIRIDGGWGIYNFFAGGSVSYGF
jgi:hypothetical protein